MRKIVLAALAVTAALAASVPAVASASARPAAAACQYLTGESATVAPGGTQVFEIASSCVMNGIRVQAAGHGAGLFQAVITGSTEARGQFLTVTARIPAGVTPGTVFYPEAFRGATPAVSLAPFTVS